VVPKFFEIHGVIANHEVGDRARDDDLAGPGGFFDTCSSVDSCAANVIASDFDFACVKSGPDPNPYTHRFVNERAGALHRSSRTVKRGKQTVAC